MFVFNRCTLGYSLHRCIGHIVEEGSGDLVPGISRMSNLEEHPQEWLKRTFEFEYCGECGQDADAHTAVPLLGNWFAQCNLPPEEYQCTHEKNCL